MWQAPNRKHKSGEPRRNAIRNQLDYIIMRRREVKLAIQGPLVEHTLEVIID